MVASSVPTRVYYIANSKKGIRKDSSKKRHETDDSTTNPTCASQVDQNKRCFVMDMVPQEAEDLEVGTVDIISELVQTYLTEMLCSLGNDNFQFPGEIVIDIQLQHNEYMDCAFLVSGYEVTSMYGDVLFGSIEIYALSGNPQDILQVLLQMEMPSFNLKFVDQKYIAEVKDFLSTNPHLRKLRIGDHYLENDQHLVLDVVKSSRSLSTLQFGGVSFPPKEIGMNQTFNDYMRQICESKSMKKLDFVEIADLSQDHIDCLTECLLEKSPSNLNAIDLSAGYGSKHLTVNIAKLAGVLRHIDTFEELIICHRILSGYDSIFECANLLKRSSCLKKLDLSASGGKRLIDPDAWTCIGEALPETCSLQYLDVSFHRISESSWRALGEGLKVNTSLLTLKAGKSYDRGGNKEINILLPVFEALHENITLQSLHLNGYDLSDSISALEVLESALIQNTALKSLQLKDSSMSDEGVAILSRSLPKMKSIRKLDLQYHGFSLDGAQALVLGIKYNYSLLSVAAGTKARLGYSCGYVPPIAAEGFAKEYHEIQYYARMNRKGRRCIWGETPIQPSLWPSVLANAMNKEDPPGGPLVNGDVRNKDLFAGNHDTSIDVVFFLLRNVMRFEAHQ
ncbi:unnamed protein product [Cylindrotheca closterium]|uniref:Uncharacterized protein n=1 Tax=Cylindrotheca closterium TaxID=2856 RepID=A0AAD2FCT0_9STRA|nr:unnamed protein product [Cylindrotheca closterium]